MPRAQIDTPQEDIVLTVTAVAQRLGIATSTLRTWDRRYGLGPSTHVAGQHRRYGPEDIRRLERMRSLISSGVAPVDASQTVMNRESEVVEISEPGVEGLLEAAMCGNCLEVRNVLNATIAQIGLVRTWCVLVKPVLEKLDCVWEEVPGTAPLAILRAAVFDAARVIVQRCGDKKKIPSGQVLLIAERSHDLQAHIAGASLMWNGLTVRIAYCPENNCSIDDLYKLAQKPVKIIGIVGANCWSEELVNKLVSQTDTELVLIGTQAPLVLAPQIVRMRTLSAAVDEITSLALTN